MSKYEEALQEALQKAGEYFPLWSQQQRTAWAKGRLLCHTLKQAPLSTRARAADRDPHSVRVSGIPSDTKFKLAKHL